MLSFLKEKLRRLRGLGASDVTPEWAAFNAASSDRALERIVRRGLEIGTVIDVGASNGSWSQMCMRHLPRADYFLVEAQPCHEEALSAFCSQNRNARFQIAAAGNEDGMCYFDDGSAFGGLASNEATETCRTQMPMVRLDSIVAHEGLAPPFLLKLDTHGFELQIIQGAEKILRHAELLVIEAYMFRLNDKALLSHELCAELDQRGYQVVDFSEPLWRERDMALWQWDLFFARKSNPVFKFNTYG